MTFKAIVCGLLLMSELCVYLCVCVHHEVDEEKPSKGCDVLSSQCH